jgi:PHD/YefM family antitoxin component YafN of YafNO toxin-antitoxin module
LHENTTLQLIEITKKKEINYLIEISTDALITVANKPQVYVISKEEGEAMSKSEEAYFHKLSREQIQELQAKRKNEQAVQEKRSHMGHCAACGGNMAAVRFEGHDLYSCVECRGVHMDVMTLKAFIDEGDTTVIRLDQHAFKRSA